MSFWKKLLGGRSSEKTVRPSATQPSITCTKEPSAPASKEVVSSPLTGDGSVVSDVKDMLRLASGALDFIARAKQAGFRAVKEDFMGLQLEKGECTLILAVLPSYGPDTIWCLSMIENKGAEIVNLVNEGQLAY